MADASFRLDRAGIGEFLRSDEMKAVVSEAAHAIAAELHSRGVSEVYIDEYVTDRAAASVTIPYSHSDELKHGRLVDAATAVALDVRAYG